MAQHRGGGLLRSVTFGGPVESRRPESRRVGVETEHEPAAARLDERREPVREVDLDRG
jgi:hypothetical protein